MAALTLVPVNPIAVIGNLRRRTYTIAGTIADGDTVVITEFSAVLDAAFTPATAAGAGIAFSGVGNRTLTFKMTASATAGRLVVVGQ